ncbi:zinc ribbon domain-containing protein [Nocardioides dongkuii]|uniref:zinc ribbon domain-containing protein n=1 Tax=Nocardioides dongkuii TaxID=2760089 RepID=UPI0015FC64F8|nr:zinc ribbon domain-containing protein [Nocardioides dongkuii]
MDSTPEPGLRHQRGGRTALRVLGGALLLAGLLLGVTGLLDFIDEFDNPAISDGPGAILRIAAGGFMTIVGLALLNAGFLGAQTRYVAGETMPVVKDSATYLSDGRGVLGVGRTAEPAAAGPFCRSCGKRNDEEARFCDGCGTALA